MTLSTLTRIDESTTTSRLAILARSTAVALLLLLPGGTALAKLPPLIASGTVGDCTFMGTVRLSPGMTMGGTSNGVVARLHGHLSSCNGGTGDGANVVGGTVRGTIVSAMPLSDCMLLFSNSLGQFDMHIRWKVARGTPKLAHSVVHVGGGFFHMDGPEGSLEMMMMGHGGTEGSFYGNVLQLFGITDQTMPEVTTKCSTGPRGLKVIRFTGQHGPSTIHY